MIKPEMVPTCVAEKLRRMVYDFETNEYVLIAAAINAWPGVGHAAIPHWPGPHQEIEQRPSIILPLTEPRNE